jgi:hypothetical protein
MRSAVSSELKRDARPTVDWKGAAVIGFFAGIIFLFATAGNPWGFSALIVPTVMGREMFGATAPHLSFGFMAVHLGLATVFALIMAPIIHRFWIGFAILISIPFGLLFYAFNYVLFHFIFPIHTNPTETGVLVTNVAFAILVAAAYRGQIRGKLDQKKAP